jgi:uncharacterized protein with NRDE domain
MVLSNGILNENWPKLNRAKERILSNYPTRPQPHRILILTFKFCKMLLLAADNDLPNTGLPFEKEKYLSSIFIQLPGYGTRSSTFVSFPRSG